MQPDAGNFQHAIDLCAVPFDISLQVFGRGYSPRIQRGSEGAGQSAGYTGNHVVQRSGVFRPGQFPAVLLLIKLFDSPVNPKVQRLLETLNMSGSMRPLMLLNANPAGMSDGHGTVFHFFES